MSRRRIFLVWGPLALIATLAFWLGWNSAFPTSSVLDAKFDKLALGMSRAEAEEILGPPSDANDETIRRVAAFRAVDHPGLHNMPTPKPTRLWWHDGRHRCLYLEFASDKIWRAALFTPSDVRYLGG
jgi:hypothetical protein